MKSELNLSLIQPWSLSPFSAAPSALHVLLSAAFLPSSAETPNLLRFQTKSESGPSFSYFSYLLFSVLNSSADSYFSVLQPAVLF